MTVSQVAKKFRVTQPESTLMCSQQLVTRPYPEHDVVKHPYT